MSARSTAMSILQVNGSARATGSNSTRLADAITARLSSQQPDARLVLRDLATNPHPVLDAAALAALSTPAAERTPGQAARVALDDTLIAEVQAADVIVLGVPMYNFGIPAQLKAWIDAIARAGVTFRYTEQGPEGLLPGKKVYVGLARGGLYRDTPADSQVPYLRNVLGFLGLEDIEFVYAEGLNMGPESARKALREAEAHIEKLVA
jgi:FMN-dependent NADH-azoreductase